MSKNSDLKVSIDYKEGARRTVGFFSHSVPITSSLAQRETQASKAHSFDDLPHKEFDNLTPKNNEGSFDFSSKLSHKKTSQINKPLTPIVKETELDELDFDDVLKSNPTERKESTPFVMRLNPSESIEPEEDIKDFFSQSSPRSFQDRVLDRGGGITRK